MLPTRIMVFGTFDILHQGHLNFFKQARKLAKQPYLIVSIARDVNVKKIKQKKSQHTEIQRLSTVKSCKLVNSAVLGGKSNYLKHILQQSPDIIALGYDQVAYVKSLRQDIKLNKLPIKVRRLKSYLPKVYKSSLLNRPIKNKVHKNVL